MSRRAPATLPNALSWAAQAACKGQDLALFFSDAEQKVQQAKQICVACPVRTACLDEAMRTEAGAARDGVYGGLTATERAQLADESPRTGRRRAPCGTPAAYRRHVKCKEPIDDACRAAKRENDRRYRCTGSTVQR
ncbi:WhiB family transcriptional regulator [Streptomyces sp. AVP053U2]|uniref:WhiB family transcriptional regulator n=1 Tax=Streptomyces sp. AVP053U2 TaxID=1737066 RepID=UPI00073C561F|nr:WhiB family transcriptional regulator [Streptomyces sp. AVP053U2]ODA69244.1 Redox-responsive transcriptional regulator WhiB3 [Streptomyces sp. AVP053U2]